MPRLSMQSEITVPRYCSGNIIEALIKGSFALSMFTGSGYLAGLSMISSDSVNFTEATERVLERLSKTKSNTEFLANLSREA